MTELIATGVPKPASASMSAPKQKAMMMACTRSSSLIEANDRRSTSKCPVATVRLYTQIALMTIHMIGKKPNAAPSSPLLSASPTGIRYAATATTTATAKAISEASHAFMRTTPSSTKRVSSGRIATADDSQSESATGLGSC